MGTCFGRPAGESGLYEPLLNEATPNLQESQQSFAPVSGRGAQVVDSPDEYGRYVAAQMQHPAQVAVSVTDVRNRTASLDDKIVVRLPVDAEHLLPHRRSPSPTVAGRRERGASTSSSASGGSSTNRKPKKQQRPQSSMPSVASSAARAPSPRQDAPTTRQASRPQSLRPPRSSRPRASSDLASSPGTERSMHARPVVPGGSPSPSPSPRAPSSSAMKHHARTSSSSSSTMQPQPTPASLAPPQGTGTGSPTSSKQRSLSARATDAPLTKKKHVRFAAPQQLLKTEYLAEVPTTPPKRKARWAEAGAGGPLSQVAQGTRLSAELLGQVWAYYDSRNLGAVGGNALLALLRDLLLYEGRTEVEQTDVVAHRTALLSLFGRTGTADHVPDPRKQWLSLAHMAKVLMLEEDVRRALTEPQVHSVRFVRAFMSADTDHDGEIATSDTHSLRHLFNEMFEGATKQRVHVPVLLRLVQSVGTSPNDDQPNTGDVAGSGVLSLSRLARLLPLEPNFLETHLSGKPGLTPAEFGRIAEHYDLDQRGALSGADLTAFVRDLLSAQRGSNHRTLALADIATYRQTLLDMARTPTDALPLPALAAILNVHH